MCSHVICWQQIPNSQPKNKTKKHHINSFFPWLEQLLTKIKDAPTVPVFASGRNTFYAIYIIKIIC